MRDSREIVNRIEKIHLDYLCDNFALLNSAYKRNYVGFRPDLLSREEHSTVMFELKSRSFCPEQLNEKSEKEYLKYSLLQCAWWHLRESQISAYEKYASVNGIEAAWIFMFAIGKNKFENESAFSEDNVISRDIFIVPWNAYLLVPEKEKGTRYIGLNKVKRKYNFIEKKITKGNLFLEESLCNSAGRFF